MSRLILVGKVNLNSYRKKKSMDKRKVCCFCEKWESGGIESFLHNVIRQMDLSRLEIDIVAAQMCESVFTADLKEKGVKFYELSGSQRKLGQNHRMFKQLLKERQYDVVHLHIFQGLSLYYAYLAKKVGVPVRIAHSHNTALRQSRTRWLKMLIHNAAKCFLAKNVTDYWACSSLAAEFMFPKDVVEKYEFIPNGIDVDKFRFDNEVRKEIRKNLDIENKFVIGNVGRLCYQKNQEYLLEVFAKLQSERSNSVLLLVGEGQMKEGLQQQAKKLGIADKVIFYGVTDKVEQLLWAMDLFVFPSRFEGLGIVVVEAQATGLPVVCSDNVPDEAVVTDLVQKIKLSNSADVWAESILNCQATMDRQAFNEQVRQSGFAVADVADRIEKAYLGL